MSLRKTLASLTVCLLLLCSGDAQAQIAPGEPAGVVAMKDLDSKRAQHGKVARPAIAAAPAGSHPAVEETVVGPHPDLLSDWYRQWLLALTQARSWWTEDRDAAAD